MRGEDTRPRSTCCAATGSPPHARGRLIEFAFAVSHPRITPACAGKTERHLSSPIDLKDHPRMRGEDNCTEIFVPKSEGSPPHARGRRARRGPRRLRLRITPACAGKTKICAVSVVVAWDHPRMRGEDDIADLGRDLQTGSPPHARGRHVAWRELGRRRGITPACAGKTGRWLSLGRRIPDHPRMRGEDISMDTVTFSTLGSPPHARGRLPNQFVYSERSRITPACAGKTSLIACAIISHWDHPRMRGED